jgi:transcription antitermination factor NusG
MGFALILRPSTTRAAPGHGNGHRVCVGVPHFFSLPNPGNTPSSVDAVSRQTFALSAVNCTQSEGTKEAGEMPLLPLEPFVYPDDLLSQPAPAAHTPARWWVLHTRPRAEKSLTRKLLRRKVPFFLPLYKRQWRNRGRMFCSYTPLFPGYVFLQSDPVSVFRLLDTNLIARILSVEEQGQLHDDLARIYCLIAAGAPLTPEDRLQPGARVEITSGSLAGLEGTIRRRGKQLKFIVEVQFLQRGVSVEVESWMIQPRQESANAAPALV